MRRPIIAGNWKMYKTFEEAGSYLTELFQKLSFEVKPRVLLAVPFPWIAFAAEKVLGTPVVIGAQNMHDEESGPFTGEVSAPMLVSAGAAFVLIGHSERRHLFGEGGEWIRRKIVAALKHGLQPILCVGETSQERESARGKVVVKAQLSEALEGLSAEEMLKVIIAYEPVWAIGTGKHASPDLAQDMHRFCRDWMASRQGASVADRIPILYGGSVTPTNISAFMQAPDVDGVLVGGASLDPVSFTKIIQYQ